MAKAARSRPPLAGSEWVNGPVSNLIRIQLRGLQGPITVTGKEYNFPGGMAALAYQTDEQIAAVLTYVRNSFGNKAPAVKPEQVAALRSEVGKPQTHRSGTHQALISLPTTTDVSHHFHHSPIRTRCCARASTARCAIR